MLSTKLENIEIDTGADNNREIDFDLVKTFAKKYKKQFKKKFPNNLSFGKKPSPSNLHENKYNKKKRLKKRSRMKNWVVSNAMNVIDLVI